MQQNQGFNTMQYGGAPGFPAQHQGLNTMKPASGPIPPMKPHGQQLMDAHADITKGPTEFNFQSHFDEEGALFFLGSFGKKRLW